MDFWTPFFLQLTVGSALGLFYFGGLLWTAQKMQAMQRPWLWAGVSFLMRAVIVVVGFALLADGVWSNLFVGLLGFLMARSALAYRYRPLLDFNSGG